MCTGQLDDLSPLIDIHSTVHPGQQVTWPNTITSKCIAIWEEAEVKW